MSQFPSLKVFKVKSKNHESTIIMANTNKPISVTDQADQNLKMWTWSLINLYIPFKHTQNTYKEIDRILDNKASLYKYFKKLVSI